MSKEINTEAIEAALERLRVQNAPMTYVSAGKFGSNIVDTFKEKMLHNASKQIKDCVGAFCGGKAGQKKAIWIKSFRVAACQHFDVARFEDFFTPEGIEGQKAAMELIRQRSQKDELLKKAPIKAKIIANKIYQLYKTAELYGAELKPLRNGIQVKMPTKSGAMVYVADAKGVRESNILAEKI